MVVALITKKVRAGDKIGNKRQPKKLTKPGASSAPNHLAGLRKLATPLR